ncbi:MAG: hypothetical protein ACD_76C00086G0001 [uncultured bacterium]|nr:MAG: hypothetical protein ACD_76C00086G0001 [uncultured bacterium]HBD05530.1 hypothetical protein [Candidatus Uhrbacteria bacterium]
MENIATKTKDSVTLPKKEYLRLKREAEAYRNIATKVFELPLRDPVGEVVSDFRVDGLYTDEFLMDLENGLRKSSYAKKYANQTSKA